jgi:hypothetical protein
MDTNIIPANRWNKSSIACGESVLAAVINGKKISEYSCRFVGKKQDAL